MFNFKRIMVRIGYQTFTKVRKYHKLSYIHNPGKEPLRPLTIGKLIEKSAEEFGDRPAIIFRAQNQVLSFQEILDQADRLAAALKTLGVNMGDRVGILAPNLIEWYLTHMACARGGYILVNMNPALQAAEIQYCINKVGLKTLICPHTFKSQNYYDIFSQISSSISKCEPGKIRSKEVPTLEQIIVIGEESLRGTLNFEEIMKLTSENDVRSIQTDQEKIDPDQACHIQFTSGTTGHPKATIQSHFQLVNNSYFIGKRNELDQKHHKVCVQVPFYHAFGTDISICAALNHGATLVVPSPAHNPDLNLDAIKEEKCSIIHGTPTMYVDLIKAQKRRLEEISPEIAVCGGASCSPQLFRAMKEVLNVKKVKSVFGMTETTAVIFQSLYDDDEYRSTSTVGYISDHLEAKVVDEKGLIVPRGTPGELWVRGYCTTLGYWQDEEKTKELIGADMWLRTGDQFILEEDGYGKIVGRIKDMIIRGGENIFPKEIEDFLSTHPRVLEVHVIGLPHERLGEEVCACIRVNGGAPFTLDDIKTYCKGKLAHFKIPSALHIVEAFPKTASGKIKKNELVKIFSNNN